MGHSQNFEPNFQPLQLADASQIVSHILRMWRLNKLNLSGASLYSKVQDENLLTCMRVGPCMGEGAAHEGGWGWETIQEIPSEQNDR